MENIRFHQGKLSRIPCALLVLSFGLWQSSAMAQTVVYTVGSSADCDYNSLRGAISAAAAQATGTARVQISFPAITSLGYSFGGNNSMVTISGPGADVRIYGGYASCSATAQTPDTYTTLKYFNAAADAPHSLLRIFNSTTTSARRRVIMRQIRMEGAFDESLGGPLYGGGVSVSSNAQLELGDSSIKGFHAEYGGGVSVAVFSGTDPLKYPRVVLFDNSSVDENTATFGGGISARRGRVSLSASSVSGNKAANSGGGIYLEDLENAGDFNLSSNRALEVRGTTVFGSVGNTISNNTAGGAAYSGTTGFGGGIFSRNGHIQIQEQAGGFLGSNGQFLAGNTANVGGAIYIQGPTGPAGTPFTLMRSVSAYFGLNVARGRGGAVYLLNAVDSTISGNGGGCGFGIFSTPICSGFFSNQAAGTDGGGFQDRGGAIHLRSDRTDEFSRPIQRVYSNMFSGNSDPNGRAAVASALGGGSRMLFNRNIFINNTANAAEDSVLVSGLNGTDVDFRYNTVLDSNTTTRMFYMNGGVLDVTGSILWGTVNRTFPFHFVWFPVNGATMNHGLGCLLVRSSDEGTADIPNPEQLWAGYAPDLDARYAPRGGSPAIDHCDDIGGAPVADIYGNGVYDTPGIAARYGNYDLGAVEQTDIIFAHTFGQRPTN